MIRKHRFLLLVLIGLLAFVPVAYASSLELEPAVPKLAVTDAYSLIAAVNNLRASNGLPAYQINSILMSVAQAHANYMAATGSVTHYSADGSRPSQRALAAGYPLGGDLSLGGFFSENIIAGNDMSVYTAVEAWQGDAPHLNTMLSANLTEVGAGVTIVDGYVYYVLDAAQPSGAVSSYSQSTGSAGVVTPAALFIPIVTSTPNEKGEVIHVVQAGQALWTIAAVYETTVEEILALNGKQNDYIFPGDQLLIGTVSATEQPEQELPTSQPTFVASATPEPTATVTPTETMETSPAPTAAPEKKSRILIVVGIVIGLALIAAGLLTFFSSRREILS